MGSESRGTLPPAPHRSRSWRCIPGAAEYGTQKQVVAQVLHGDRRMGSGKATGFCVPLRLEQTLKPKWGMKEVAVHAPGRKQSFKGEQDSKRGTPKSLSSRFVDATFKT